MSAQTNNKAAEKSNSKTNANKAATDQDKAINQLRQEIRSLSKTVKEMQQKLDIQAVNIAIPQKLLSRVNACLSEYEKDIGKTIGLSEFICEAIDLYLYGEEQNKRLEEERTRAGLENNEKK